MSTADADRLHSMKRLASDRCCKRGPGRRPKNATLCPTASAMGLDKERPQDTLHRLAPVRNSQDDPWGDRRDCFHKKEPREGNVGVNGDGDRDAGGIRKKKEMLQKCRKILSVVVSAK